MKHLDTINTYEIVNSSCKISNSLKIWTLLHLDVTCKIYSMSLQKIMYMQQWQWLAQNLKIAAPVHISATF